MAVSSLIIVTCFILAASALGDVPFVGVPKLHALPPQATTAACGPALGIIVNGTLVEKAAGNKNNRWPGQPNIGRRRPEGLPFLTAFKRDSLPLLGPTRGPADTPAAQFQTPFHNVFNPAAFGERDPITGEDIIHIIVRGEYSSKDPRAPRVSFPHLYEYRPNAKDPKNRIRLIMEKAILDITLKEEEPGGMEDFRAFEFKYKPAVHNRKEYKRMLTYTAYDGKVARICGVLFNDASDLREGRAVKIGPLFKDEDILKNPNFAKAGEYNKAVQGLPPEWNKSASVLQYERKGKVHTVVWFNEGDHRQGGIWSIEVDNPAVWPYPTDPSQKPVVTTRPGKPDQNLVESASPPFIAPLPWWIREKTGQTEGIYGLVHGDSPDGGYQVVWKVYSLDNPTGKPIYESDGSFLWPTTAIEKDQGQVDGVVFLQAAVLRSDGETLDFFYGSGDRVISHATAKLKDVPTERPKGK